MVAGTANALQHPRLTLAMEMLGFVGPDVAEGLAAVSERQAPLPVGAAAYRRPHYRMGEMAGGPPRPPERPARQPDTIAAEPSRAEARARSSPGWILWLAVRGSSSSVKKSTCRGTL